MDDPYRIGAAKMLLIPVEHVTNAQRDRFKNTFFDCLQVIRNLPETKD